ncbi:MAG: hypothetical protein WA532_00450 [Candidatus Korobacteraceae bacterium]
MTEENAVTEVPTEIIAPPAQRSYGKLFLASFAALYFELLVIRYLSTELQVFTSLKNLPLIASFFGIGVGMMLWNETRWAKRAFFLVAAALFILARFGARLPQSGLGWGYDIALFRPSLLLSYLAYLAEVLGVLWLTVIFFVVLGGLIGKHIKQASPLASYGVNLGGSLAGMLAFTLLSFLSTPPAVWLAIGFLSIAVFFWRERVQLAAFVLLVGVTAIPQPNTYWSPYHRIDLQPIRAAESSVPSAYSLRYNHMWYQTMVDLSPDFVRKYPAAEPNHAVRDYYELPYRFVTAPRDVLVVGAGTGNDVAAALRHGAEHVDAVEIDPVILGLGRRYHPEQPYSSTKVTAHIDDARAYFQKCSRRYDLIVFGFLDSSTLLTSASSLRLDDYVYTRQSFEAARRLLKPDGTLILAFAVTRGFVADRLFVTLSDAFGVEPRAFTTKTNVYGMVYIEGAARSRTVSSDVPEATADIRRSSLGAPVASDDWPFLYLSQKRVPASLALALLIFVGSLWLWQSVKVQEQLPADSTQFFLLGAGFLLLETRAVTQLSLLFGSTWLVVAVVVSLFLFMALAANALVMRFTPNPQLCYVAVLFLIVLGTAMPYSQLAGFSMTAKICAAALGAALPVFFSGLIFSSVLKRSVAPSAALGMNLLGAVIGGVLENGVMIGGIMLVGGLALLAYAGAWLCSRSKRREDTCTTEVAVNSRLGIDPAGQRQELP